MPNRFHDATSQNPVNPRDLIRWPSVAIINRARQPLGVDLEQLADALQEFVAIHFGPVWNCFCTVAVKNHPDTGDWPLLLVDDDRQADAVAYHDLAADNVPEMVVDVTKALKYDGTISLAAGHELAETLPDPGCNLAAFMDDGRAVAYETVDPVQAGSFDIKGLKMPNFVTPEWFNGGWSQGAQPFDYCGQIDTPLTLAPGGYAMVYYPASRRWLPVVQKMETLERIKSKLDRPSRLDKRHCSGNGWLVLTHGRFLFRD